jgi:hypothetical protein
MSTENEVSEYQEYSAETKDGKKLKWAGKPICKGNGGNIYVDVTETRGGTIVAEVYNDHSGDSEVLTASNVEELIDNITQHFDGDEETLAAFQDAFPDEEMWVETID